MKMILLVSCKYNPFSKEMLCTWPHFDSESFGSQKWPVIALAVLCHPLSPLADRIMAGVGRGEER